jgi:hypothetical protein
MNFYRFLNYEEIKGCGVIPHYNCKKKINSAISALIHIPRFGNY